MVDFGEFLVQSKCSFLFKLRYVNSLGRKANI